MRVIAGGAAVALIVAGIFLARPAPVGNLDSKVCDLLTGWVSPGKPSGRVVIVEIDERSLTQFGPWPWPRDLTGLLARRMLECGASVVVFDMMFPPHELSVPASTRELAPPAVRSAERIGVAPSGTNDDVLAQALSGKPTIIG